MTTITKKQSAKQRSGPARQKPVTANWNCNSTNKKWKCWCVTAPPVALVGRRMKCLSTSRCLFGRMMPAFVGVSSQSVLTSAVSAVIHCRLSRVRAMVIQHVG